MISQEYPSVTVRSRFSPLMNGKSLTEPISLLTGEGLTEQGENGNRAKHDDKSDCLANKSDAENRQNYGLDTGSESKSYFFMR